jgi:hypothetical protein
VHFSGFNEAAATDEEILDINNKPVWRHLGVYYYANSLGLYVEEGMWEDVASVSGDNLVPAKHTHQEAARISWPLGLIKEGDYQLRLVWLASNDLSKNVNVEFECESSNGPLTTTICQWSDSPTPHAAWTDFYLPETGKPQVFTVGPSGEIKVSIVVEPGSAGVMADLLLLRPIPKEGDNILNLYKSDALIVDADGVEVFDTRLAWKYRSVQIGANWRRHDWLSDKSTLTIIQNINYQPTDPLETGGPTINTRGEIVTPNSLNNIYLSSRSTGYSFLEYGREPTQYGATKLSNSIRFLSGVNTKVEADGDIINFSLSEGPATSDVEDDYILRIGGAYTTDGNFVFSGDGCTWVRPVTELVDAPAPDGFDGKVSRVPGELLIRDDCRACCTCAHAQAAIDYLTQLKDRLMTSVSRERAITAAFNYLVDAYESIKDCREAKIFDVKLEPVDCKYVDVTIQFCNSKLVKEADNGKVEDLCIGIGIEVLPDCVGSSNCYPPSPPSPPPSSPPPPPPESPPPSTSPLPP